MGTIVNPHLKALMEKRENKKVSEEQEIGIILNELNSNTLSREVSSSESIIEKWNAIYKFMCKQTGSMFREMDDIEDVKKEVSKMSKNLKNNDDIVAVTEQDAVTQKTVPETQNVDSKKDDNAVVNDDQKEADEAPHEISRPHRENKKSSPREVRIKEISDEDDNDETEDGDDNIIRLDRFVYGNDEGYQILGCSNPDNSDAFLEPFQGKLLPVSNAYVKSIGDPVRIILSSGNSILFSRLQNDTDELNRGSVLNHTVIIDRKHLREGRITYESIDKAMANLEKKSSIKKKGQIPQLEVGAGSTDLDEYCKDVKNYLSIKTVDSMIDIYMDDPEKKIILLLPKSTFKERRTIAYLLSAILEFNLRVNAISAFPDTPYSDAKDIFNLIITHEDPRIRPTSKWAMLVYDPTVHDFSKDKVESKKILKKFF